jgi:uncharacterized protein (DUF736 family)
MPAIGYVRRTETGFEGQLKTLSIQAATSILRNTAKSADGQPDYKVFSVEIGAGWIRAARSSGAFYVSLSLAAPEFGPRKLYANLGRAAGQDDPDVFAVIWNPLD